MAEAVKEEIVIKGVSLPGYIVTKLDDFDFLMSVLREWAQYPENKAWALMLDAVDEGETLESALRSGGFWVIDNNHPNITVHIIKIDEGKWVIPGMDFEDLEEFAESCEGNLE